MLQLASTVSSICSPCPPLDFHLDSTGVAAKSNFKIEFRYIWDGKEIPIKIGHIVDITYDSGHCVPTIQFKVDADVSYTHHRDRHSISNSDRLGCISKTALFPPQVLTCHMSNSVSTLKPSMQKAYFGYKEGSVKFLGKVYRPVFLSIFCTALYHWVPFCDFL